MCKTDRENQIEREWREIIESVNKDVRDSILRIAQRHAQDLSRDFYALMMQDPIAIQFLDHALVEQKLSGALCNWIVSVFSTNTATEIAAGIALQRRIGESHARIKVPANLIGRSLRYLKRWIVQYLSQESGLDKDALVSAIAYIHEVIDLAVEVMTASFIVNADRASRADEGYRLFSLTQDLAIERERQRAALAEWSQHVVHVTFQRPGVQAGLLRNSELGMWLRHKGAFMFESASELPLIEQIVERVDSQFVPLLCGASGREQTGELLRGTEEAISELKFLLSTLFERHLELENGRDPLTKLLNRRFLASALSREVDLAKRSHHRFAIALLDVDHFKQVNDTYGHDAGDSVLQQIAGHILNVTRSGDFVFRYGGEEMLVLLVDTDAEQALAFGEKLRQTIANASILLSAQRTIHVTVSVGIAAYDGHPDYKQLITRADAALYKAKETGRNRSVVAR